MATIDTLVLGLILSLIIMLGSIAIISGIIILGYYIIPIIVVLYVVGWFAKRSGFEL